MMLAGIKDIWAKGRGQTRVKSNLIKACIDAFKNLNNMRISHSHISNLSIVEGSVGITKQTDSEFAEAMKVEDKEKLLEKSSENKKEKAKEKTKEKINEKSKEKTDIKSKSKKNVMGE